MPATRARRSADPPPMPRTEAAYRAIKNEILSNRLAPGEAVPMERFVRDLKLSRTPVREAILQLAKEGFIDVRPRMGTFVSHLDLRQIQEMYEVRRLMEGYAARLAAARVDRDNLESLHRALSSFDTERGPDWKAISEAGQKVHALIVESCGNRVLAEKILSLQDHFARFRALSLQIPRKVLASHQEHLRVLGALLEGDGALAERRIHEHFDHAAQMLVEDLLSRGGGQAAPRVTVGAI